MLQSRTLALAQLERCGIAMGRMNAEIDHTIVPVQSAATATPAVR